MKQKFGVAYPISKQCSWHVLFARADTPKEMVNRLYGDMKRIMECRKSKGTIVNLGLIPHATPSIDGIQVYIKSEIEKWGAQVRSLGLAGSQHVA